MQSESERARPSDLVSLICACITALGACRDHSPDGAAALNAFRSYVGTTFSEKSGDSECDLRTDVRATQGVAEPWEGLLHAEIFIMEKTGKRNRFGWTVDAVFDRAGSTWTCSPTKSKSADITMKPCESLQRFCQQATPETHNEKSLPNEVGTPRTATLYPVGWEDLPPYGEVLVDYAARAWGCATKQLPTGEVVRTCAFCRNSSRFGCAELSISLKTSAGKQPSNRIPASALTFTPSKETGYAEALADVEPNAKRPPDATNEQNQEAGTARTACWHNKDSTTSIESGYALARGSIVMVTARDPQRCAK